MDYEFLINNKITRMAIKNNNSDGSYEISLGGDPIELQVSHPQPNSLTFRIGNQSITAYIAKQDSKFFVHIDGKSIELTIPDSKQKKYSKEGMEYDAKDEITTPMPGKIVRLLVKVGDVVKPKQPLVIVESMKMENEIKSSMEGTVKAVNFKPGDLVSSGQTIIKLSKTA